MKKRETAVMLLGNEIANLATLMPNEVLIKLNQIYSLAINQEEEEIVDAFYAGIEAEGLESGEDYYAKTYGE